MSRVIGRKWRRLSKYVCLLGLMSIVLWTFYVKIVRRDYADRSVIPITIVEEHHEVLPHWFDAVRFGMLPKGNITVFHIDGHSDEAPPEYIPEMPFFQWPRNDLEERAMMQKNDIFIQMSAVVGFLGRFIWLVPDWLKQEVPNMSNDTVELGYFYHQYSKPQLNKSQTKPDVIFCDCRTSNTVKLKDDGCAYVNYSSDAGDDIKIKREVCSVKTKYISETVLEGDTYNKAVRQEHLKTSKISKPEALLGIRNDEPVIWDIDLDYFGCEIPGDSLLQAGFTWRVVELIDQKLNRLFCPSRFEDESESNQIMKGLISTFISQCDFSSVNIRCKKPFQFLRKITDEKLTDVWKRSPRLFCASNDLQLRNAWKDVAFIFHHLKLEQLQALTSMGFCFNISPKTFGVENFIAVHICHGLNPPHSEVIEKYSPTYEDIMERLTRLEYIMTSLPPPRMVTICRSARDGYVPRKQYMDIENKLIEVIFKSQPSKRFRLIYDEDLLGGMEGLVNWGS